MRKMSKIAGVLLAMVLIFSFMGCGGSDSKPIPTPTPTPIPTPIPTPTPTPPPVENEYAAQEGISIDVFNSVWLIGAITTDILNDVEQKRVTMGDRVYIAYAISDIVEKLVNKDKLSPFTKIVYDTTDNRPAERITTSFNDAYVAIGYLNANNILNTADSPRFLPDLTTNVKFAYRITVNPLAALNNEHEVPVTYRAIDIYDGENKLGDITAADL